MSENHPVLQGSDWQCVNPQAPWQGRDSQGYFVHQDKMWMFGGWFSGSEPAPRDVWNSDDGSRWTRLTDHAPWTHGDMPACVVHAGKMWLIDLSQKMPPLRLDITKDCEHKNSLPGWYTFTRKFVLHFKPQDDTSPNQHV